MSTTTLPRTISAQTLLHRIAAGRPVQVLDIRADHRWTVDGPGVDLVTITSGEILADPAAAAARLGGRETVVVCNRGITAASVLGALTEAGADAMALEHGMRGWIAALGAVPVDAQVPDAEIIQVQRPGRGCLSYVVVSGDEALVVDPAPDVDYYTRIAEDRGARITSVVDTHIHADHLSGARELADRTGATLRLPAEAAARGLAYSEAVVPLADGDLVPLGTTEVAVRALPGHTTDMTGLVVGGRALIGGDSLFADGIARPDLQEGDPDGARMMARRLHATLHDRVLALGDDVVLLPGHTHPGVPAGAVAPTLAEVRAVVPELAIEDPSEFAERLVAGMPPRPENYESIIAVNTGLAPVDAELETGGNSCSAG